MSEYRTVYAPGFRQQRVERVQAERSDASGFAQLLVLIN
jgi:hypothetical protein